MYRDFSFIDTVISWVYWAPFLVVILAISFGLSKLAEHDPAKDETPRWGEIISYVLRGLSALYAAYWVFGGLFVKGYEVPGITRRVLVTLVLSLGFGYAAYFSNILLPLYLYGLSAERLSRTSSVGLVWQQSPSG